MAGLVIMAAALVQLHAVLLGRRRRIFGHLAVLCDRLMPAARGSVSDADADLIRAALLGGGVAALIDASALPLLLIVLALVVGLAAAIPLVGAFVAALLLIAARQPAYRFRERAQAAQHARDAEAMAGVHRRDLLGLLGLTSHARAAIEGREQEVAVTHMMAARQSADLLGRIWLVAALTMTITLGSATWLMANDAASTGALVAALLLTLFVLAPLVRIAGHLDSLAAAGPSWRAFRGALASVAAPRPQVALPPPVRRVEVSGVAVPVHGTRRLMLQDVSFAAEAGDVLAVIGPADVGKSTLLKLLAGQLSAAAGAVRLDGAALDQWDEDARAAHIGYLPQTPDLLPGSVAQNIARFDGEADPAGITRAALAAGAHEAIVRLPAGYDTQIGAADAPPLALSVQHRIALARALYGDPFLLLLDHPSAFQDNDGNAALRRCLAGASARGAVTIVVGDSAAIIDSASLVLVLRKGGMADFGTKEEVRARLVERQRRDAERLAAVSVCADPRGSKNP
ncbi:ATP-binding cassette domain-containing protein [Sphingomonas jeddahensis]|nr:ATP-binding cassette domain-containing protein [Sphingomonas jeddahensis]